MKSIELICKGSVSGSHGTTVSFHSKENEKSKAKDTKPGIPVRVAVIVGIQFSDHSAAKEFTYGETYTLTLK